MNVVVAMLEKASTTEDQDAYSNFLHRYVVFSRKNQTAPQPAGFMGLGEPKFLIGGTVFTEPWGKPQNDGPALRTITLCRWANLLLDKNAADPIVFNEIKPIIMDDLTFVRDHWGDKCVDLWEEVRGEHFYTRMVQRRALLDGAKVLDRVSRMALATSCRAQISALETAINSHFDSSAKYIRATRHVEGDDKGKMAQLDVAVILAALHGATPANPFFSPADDKVLATVTKLRNKSTSLYAINGNTTDGDGKPMSPAIGRYPEDIYDGANNNSTNPWFLATAAFAEHAYEVRNAYLSVMTITVSDLNRDFLISARDAGGSSTALNVGDVMTPSDGRFSAIIKGLNVIGDGYLRRVRLHAADDGSLSEQFKGSNGFMTSAVDLTWSYAALLTAAAKR